MESSRDDFVIAIRSAFLKKGNKQTFSLLSLILFSIIFLILENFNFKVINFSRALIKEVVHISSFVATIPEKSIKKSFDKMSDHFMYYDDYQVVKGELKKLKSKNLSNQIITYENIELKKLIADYFVEDSQTYAKVLIDKKSPFLRSVIINKGSKNGVKAGMIVYDDIYLIGKVVEVNFITARVLLISDINSKVPVTIQPLNIQGIMSGYDKQNGKLEYIRNEKLINKGNEELIVVTSGVGGVFKSGIPIGKINSTDILNNNKIIVNFYKDFSQLKYVKISSHSKELIEFDQPKKENFEQNNEKIIKINNQIEDIKLLQQQKIINAEVRVKIEEENIKLRNNLINTQTKLVKLDKEIKDNLIKNKNIKFLKLNLLYGHKCRKTIFRTKLYKINSEEYKICVFNKGPNKKN